MIAADTSTPAPARVLHIEDNPSNRKVVQHIFRSLPYALLEAVDGEAGIEVAHREQPDLILLDMQLPGASGYEVATQLKGDEATRNIPIIAVTSYAMAGDDARAREAGCDDYLAKPFRPQQLREVLQRHLSA